MAMTDDSQVSHPTAKGPGSVSEPIDIDSLSDEDTAEQALPPRREGNNSGPPPVLGQLGQSTTRTHSVPPSVIQGDRPIASGLAPGIPARTGISVSHGHTGRHPTAPRFVARPTPLMANPGFQSLLSRARQAHPYSFARAQQVDKRKQHFAHTTAPPASASLSAPTASAATAPSAPPAPSTPAAPMPNPVIALAPGQAVIVEEVRRLTYITWGPPDANAHPGILLCNELVNTHILKRFSKSG
ncbi:hypothetical protein FRC12_002887 [Ceratobasidium sp. 428]|nr:hypothetical protein FRC12_002887 [Ceratobasidium sp. 428]